MHSKFQVILLVVFGSFIVASVLFFAFYSGTASNKRTVTIWGDIPSHSFSRLLNISAVSVSQDTTVRYTEKSAETIEAEFTEALARGGGPDLVIFTQDVYWKHRPKLLLVPYTSISERDFEDTFIEEAELYLEEGGVYALPLTIDPLVLYYNRDILSTAGYASPISYWDEIYTVTQNISQRDAAGNLVRSVIALGGSDNIPHAKDILSLLMMQAGTPIVGQATSKSLGAQISDRLNFPVAPGESSLEFYTQFSNPARAYYSWNRSLIDAQTHFTSGDTAYYLGFASELRALRNKNPTLNFAVSSVPQSRISGRAITFGKMRGVSVSRGSKNPSAALEIAIKLASRDSASALAEELLLPPARRDLLGIRPTDSILSVFYDAALQSKGWIDPDAEATEEIFIEAIESVTSGRARLFEAVSKMDKEVGALLK